MNAYESFELFAEKFYQRYGYLPPGKDDRNPPDAYRVKCDLAECFGELLKVRGALEKILKVIKQ